MDRLAIISDSLDGAQDIGRRLHGAFKIEVFARTSLPIAKPHKYTIVDIDLRNGASLAELRSWLDGRPKHGKALFAVERGVRRESVQAYAIGATDVIDRPVDSKKLFLKLLGEAGTLGFESAIATTGTSGGVSAGIAALRGIFTSAISGSALDLAMVEAAGETVVKEIEAAGLAHWIDIVREHHSQTFQHCLLVTGVAVTYGRQLGFAFADRQKLAFAGLLHDIGKARIPLAILEKPGPLDARELAVMQQHPALGYEVLKDMRGLDPHMLDMVMHHHEYLDGSGYPHGLKSRELPDLVRMITIADMFGALIERRAYKPPLSGTDAYHHLEEMGEKLDPDLVRAFRPISNVQAK
jgi:putative nucleotidyltransferase with HDIG domain